VLGAVTALHGAVRWSVGWAETPSGGTTDGYRPTPTLQGNSDAVPGYRYCSRLLLIGYGMSTAESVQRGVGHAAVAGYFHRRLQPI